MYSLMNCTPHPVALLRCLFDGEVLAHTDKGLIPPVTGLVPMNGSAKDVEETLILPPSGFRLACDARASGPALGCRVDYQLSDEAKDELEWIWNRFGQAMNVMSMYVVASEISVRALDGRLYQNSAGLPIVATWPVLARESLCLPMAQRWANRLATLHRPVFNEAGEVVGMVADHLQG
jgi:hypothetical protein